ncbi:MAG: rRNA pseudouridine synthase [Selenomonadaceae bacterium]|nr:rRNA pseudouridine synthase [Selenomonadaceae bacterium]
MERLQKLIARAGICSRRAAEDLIAAGRVTVDGKIVRELGAKAEPSQNKIRVDGRLLTFDAEKIYLLMNKPRGYVSTVHDDRGRRTVLDLLDENFSERVYPVGRLDLNSEGLLLLTNDGDLTNALLHPRREVTKTYRARVTGTVTEDKLDKLRTGIELDDGLTAPAEIYLLDDGLVEITIHEGRNRQVRRMFAAIGCDVKRLRRVKFAGLTLDGLKVGQVRSLSADEISRLKNFACGCATVAVPRFGSSVKFVR